MSSLKAGLYGHNSKGLDKSIDEQIVEGRRTADDNGWPIVAEYSDGVSASRFGRKVRRDWQRLLTDLNEGLLDVIITWEPSRADRDLETWVGFVARCRAKGVLIRITGEDETLDPRSCPSHWRRLIEGGLDAAMESEKISRRVRRGVAGAAASGGFHGDCPYGYERVIVGKRQTVARIAEIDELRNSTLSTDPLAAVVNAADQVQAWADLTLGDQRLFIDRLCTVTILPSGGVAGASICPPDITPRTHSGSARCRSRTRYR